MTGLGSSCGACKFLRRRCSNDCIFAPYFSYEQAPSHFAAVHKVFGASNVSKLLSHLPVHSRSDAAITMSYEALARMHDPVYGCVAHIFALQQQVACLKEEIETLGNQMVNVGEFQNTMSSDPCLVAGVGAEFGITENYINQQILPIQHLENAMADEAWSSHIELQQYQDEISQCYFDSIIFDRLLAELNQDYYVHA